MPRIIYAILLVFIIVILLGSCTRNADKEEITAKEHLNKQQVVLTSDYVSNGGELEILFGDKKIIDNYVIAQFTARSNIFKTDNLQIFNYNTNSEKYPRFLISIDLVESDLGNWANRAYPLNLCSLLLNEDSVPVNSEGQVQILRITEDELEGEFLGNLINVVSNERTKIQGRFKARLKLNV